MCTVVLASDELSLANQTFCAVSSQVSVITVSLLGVVFLQKYFTQKHLKQYKPLWQKNDMWYSPATGFFFYTILQTAH